MPDMWDRLFNLNAQHQRSVHPSMGISHAAGGEAAAWRAPTIMRRALPGLLGRRSVELPRSVVASVT